MSYHTLRMPLWLSSRLDVFRSRWRIQLSWRCRTPRSSWIIKVFTSPERETSCFNRNVVRWRREKSIRDHVVLKSELFLIQFSVLLHTNIDQSSTTSHITWQEGLLHGFHEALQVMFYVIHHDVNLVHIASNNYFLIQWGKSESYSHLKHNKYKC